MRNITRRTKAVGAAVFVVAAAVFPGFPAAGFPAGAVPAAAPVAQAASRPFYYGVWLPFWRSKSGATDVSLHLDRLHEVSPFSYAVRPDGTLIDDLRIGDGSWNPWFSAVRAAGVKIIPTVAWLDGNAINALLSDGSARRALETRIADLVKQNDFSGIDIDFEGMPSSTRNYYSLFIYGLALRLHPAGKTLACTVTPRMPESSMYASNPLPPIAYSENYTVLNRYCDEVRVMAYDQGLIDIKLDALKGNGTLYAPVADPAWVRKVILETIRWVNPRKVMLGIPTYGYEYQVSWRMGATTYERVRSFDYTGAMERALSMGIVPYRNNAGELSFTYASSTHITGVPNVLTGIVASTLPAALAGSGPDSTSTTFFVSFSDAQAIAQKIALAKAFGLRGAILFKADGGMDPATWNVMR